MSWLSDEWDAGVGAVQDIGRSITGQKTRAQEHDQQRAQDANTHAHQQLAALQAKRQGLQVHGHDPASITQHDNWENWDHQRLVDQLRNSLNHGRIQSAGAAWTSMGERLSQLFGGLEGEARAAAGDGMQGKGAEAALGASRPLQDWGNSFGQAVSGTGMSLQQAGITAEQTHAAIQTPNDPGTARQVFGVVAPGVGLADGMMQMKQREEDEKAARAVAQNVYTPGYTGVDSSVPTLPPPVNPLNPPPPPPGQPNSTGIPSSQTPSSHTSGSVLSSHPSSHTPSTVHNSGSHTPSTHPGQTPDMRSPNGSGPSGNESAWATPQPANPTPGMAPPGGGAPGVGGGAGGAGMVGMPGGGTGAGAGAGAGGKGALGAGGRAGAGGPGSGAGAGTGGRAGGAAGAAGRPGGQGAGGMGGAKGKGEGGGEDEEHDRPGWLEEVEDVWMNDMPKVAPAVFGE